MMRRKRLRKWLALSVLSAMLLALVPASVWAAGEIGTTESTAAEQQEQKQIVYSGGTDGNLEDDGVEISKTISPTGSENIFDISLQVKTTQNISEIYDTPDAAVVIVMDISNTMNEKFPQGSSSSRYDAAISSAEDFITQFQQRSENSKAERKIGYVAFNTDAHRISEMTECRTAAQASALKKAIKERTGNIINDGGYTNSHSRFTNMEAGLKLGADMLEGVSADNKYMIFLSDGFPTTYISSGYSGYDPYCTAGEQGNDGVFYDAVTDKYCKYGTSYSNKAAAKARKTAASIKSAGIKIFAVGIDIGGQTIQKFINQTAGAGYTHSVVDRENETYELGSADSADAFRNWLRNSIGSNFYYDSNDTAGLSSAYDKIFEEIRKELEKKVTGKWVTEDPVPEYISFVSFFDNKGALSGDTLAGEWKQEAENTVGYTGSGTISWDLKKSGYTLQKENDRDIYTYTLKYRVRLVNEQDGFKEEKQYKTNGTTTLKYMITVNGQTGEDKTLQFPVPEIKGYTGELDFDKVDSVNRLPVNGAEFKLKHADDLCAGGDSTTCSSQNTLIEDITAVSDSEGRVKFDAIASGHIYRIYETKAGPGYTPVAAEGLEIGTVIVSYGQTKFIPKDAKDPVDKFIMENTAETGSLVLEKQVETDEEQGLYNPGNQKTYDFTIKGPVRAFGEYEAVRSCGDNQDGIAEKVIFDNDNTARITLKDRERIKISGIPVTAAGEVYTVIETNAASTARLIMLTPEFKNGESSTVNTSVNAQVEKNSETKLICINRFTKPGEAECIPDIVINKRVEGEEIPAGSADSFKFTMKALGYSLPDGGLAEEALTPETMPTLGEFTVSSSEIGDNKRVTKDTYKYTQAGTYYYKITETAAGRGYSPATSGYYIKDTVTAGDKEDGYSLHYSRSIYRIDALQSANSGISNLDEVFGSGAELNTEGAEYGNDGVLQFINIFTAPRSLTVQKTVGGNAYSTDCDFEFTVYFDSFEPGTVIKGTLIKRNGETENIEKTVTAAAEGDKEKPGGSISFTLKAYEAVTFDALPRDTKYSIKEKPVAGYSTEASRNGQKTEIRDNEVTGEITAGSGETVVFKNSRSEYVYTGCSLNITKKVTGIDNSDKSRELMKNYYAVVNYGDKDIILTGFKWNGSCWQSSTYTVTSYVNIDYDVKEPVPPQAEGYTFKETVIAGGDNGVGGGAAKPGENDFVTVVNDYEQIKDTPSEDSEDPQEPDNPAIPNKPDKPDSEKPDKPVYDSKVVKTGDESGIAVRAGIFGVSALLLAGAAVFTARRKPRRKDM
ncbi:MAG: SpaA isopeptide-forming pilin-related protein [Anaerovoracaceae bacterium]|nr:SpaA isopeptide-forming pilin-related protein [Anaerovoracaceae bacterium]